MRMGGIPTFHTYGTANRIPFVDSVVPLPSCDGFFVRASQTGTIGNRAPALGEHSKPVIPSPSRVYIRSFLVPAFETDWG